MCGSIRLQGAIERRFTILSICRRVGQNNRSAFRLDLRLASHGSRLLISAAVTGTMWVVTLGAIGTLHVLFADPFGVALCSGIIYNGHSHVSPVTVVCYVPSIPFDG
ncbi:MAG: hypothetical protein ABSG53_02800 [Thermoguttaceae bacterium]